MLLVRRVQEDEHEGRTPESPLGGADAAALARVCFEGHEEPRGTLQLQACRLAGTLKVASSSWRQLLSP